MVSVSPLDTLTRLVEAARSSRRRTVAVEVGTLARVVALIDQSQRLARAARKRLRSGCNAADQVTGRDRCGHEALQREVDAFRDALKEIEG